MRQIAKNTTVSWRMGETPMRGVVISGPHKLTPEEHDMFLETGDGVRPGPYHVVKAGRVKHHVITRYLRAAP